jgi:hypothetical protein
MKQLEILTSVLAGYNGPVFYLHNRGSRFICPTIVEKDVTYVAF